MITAWSISDRFDRRVRNGNGFVACYRVIGDGPAAQGIHPVIPASSSMARSIGLKLADSGRCCQRLEDAVEDLFLESVQRLKLPFPLYLLPCIPSLFPRIVFLSLIFLRRSPRASPIMPIRIVL